jgi:hypothetical protein
MGGPTVSKTDWESFDKRMGHKTYAVSFDILGPFRKWRQKKREEKKRQLIMHQEMYAMAVKAEEHRKAEAIQRAKRNIERDIKKPQ